MKETINVILICGISEVNITLDKHPHIHTSESEAGLMCLYVDVDIRRREGCGRPHFLAEVWSTALHGGMVENGEEEVRRMSNRKRWWQTSGYFKNCKIG